MNATKSNIAVTRICQNGECGQPLTHHAPNSQLLTGLTQPTAASGRSIVEKSQERWSVRDDHINPLIVAKDL